MHRDQDGADFGSDEHRRVDLRSPAEIGISEMGVKEQGLLAFKPAAAKTDGSGRDDQEAGSPLIARLAGLAQTHGSDDLPLDVLLNALGPSEEAEAAKRHQEANWAAFAGPIAETIAEIVGRHKI